MLLGLFLFWQTPNGWAQWQRWDRQDFSIMEHFWQNALARERQRRCPLMPLLVGR